MTEEKEILKYRIQALFRAMADHMTATGWDHDIDFRPIVSHLQESIEKMKEQEGGTHHLNPSKLIMNHSLDEIWEYFRQTDDHGYSNILLGSLRLASGIFGGNHQKIYKAIDKIDDGINEINEYREKKKEEKKEEWLKKVRESETEKRLIAKMKKKEGKSK
jgi:hypothetical protein